MSFFEELKRRNVFRVGIAYVIGGWLLLQLTDVLSELLSLSADIGPIVVTLVAIGFPVALFAAWIFEMTPEGVKLESEVDRSQSIGHQTGRKLNIAITVMLVAALGYFIYESRFMQRGASEKGVGSNSFDSNKLDPTPFATPFADSQSLDRRSIAVLPFANRSLKEEDQFFTDGIHDDLLTQLAKINGLKVVSRTSVMQYRDTSQTIEEIAQALGVGTILEGGIQRAGDRVRINAQLIDVNGDQHLWAETFDREMTVENIFDIQSEITRQITQAVRGELNEEERATLARIPTDNLQAYEAYLKAIALMNQADYEQENFQNAERWATRAVELDPDFAQAWAILVEINAQAVWIGYEATPEREAAALDALDNARRLGPGLAETIAAEAEYAYRIQHNFPAAALLFKKASELLPGDSDLLFRLGVAQRRTSDIAGAQDTFRRAMTIDPNNARPVAVLLEVLVFSGQLSEAQTVLQRALARFPLVVDLKAYEIELALALGQGDLALGLLPELPALTSTMVVTATVKTPLIAGDFQQAINAWDAPHVKSYESNRGFVGMRESFRAWAWSLLGEQETAKSEARACVERLSRLPPAPDNLRALEMVTLGTCYAFLDEPELAIRAVNEAQRMIPERKDQYAGALLAHDRALILAMAGERDAALAELARLLETPYPPSKQLMQIDRRWDFFRDDPRFNALIATDGAPAP